MPMYERATVLRAAMPRSRRKYAYSVSPSGRSSGARLRMLGGIVWSMSTSSDGTPIAASIAARSAESGPMCLDWKEPGVAGVIAMLKAEC